MCQEHEGNTHVEPEQSVAELETGASCGPGYQPLCSGPVLVLIPLGSPFPALKSQGRWGGRILCLSLCHSSPQGPKDEVRNLFVIDKVKWVNKGMLLRYGFFSSKEQQLTLGSLLV